MLCVLSYTYKHNYSLNIFDTHNSDPVFHARPKKHEINIYTGLQEDVVHSHPRQCSKIEQAINHYLKKYRICAHVSIHPLINSAEVYIYSSSNLGKIATQCIIASFIPKLVSLKRHTPNEFEQKLFYSLSIEDYETYTLILDDFYQSLPKSSRQDTIKQLIINAQSNAISHNLSTIESELEDCKNEIERIQTSLRAPIERYQRKLEEIRNTKNLIMSIENSESELADYLCNHNHIKVIGVENNAIKYLVMTKLDFYEEEGLRILLNNKNSIIYKKFAELPKNTLEQFLTTLFLESRYNVKVYGTFTLHLPYTITADKTPANHIPKDYIANEHIEVFGCMGSNGSVIMNALMNQNYAFAIEQSIAAIRNINFNDYFVLTSFLSRIMDFESSGCIIFDSETNTHLTPKQLLDRIISSTNT